MKGCDLENQKAIQAVKWATERLSRERRGKEFKEAFGMSHNALSDLRKMVNPPAHAIIALATFFGMSVDEMIEEAWSQREKADDEDESLADPRKIPTVCVDALTRFGQTDHVRGDIPMSSELETLDELRFSNPMRVLLELQQRVPNLPGEQIPYALQIAASCFRSFCDFKEAAFCLRKATGMASRLGNRLAKGDILQRWVYLFGSLGWRASSLRKNEESILVFHELFNLRKQGEALVDRGFCLQHLKKYKESARSYRSAGAYSIHLNRRNKASRLQGLSTSLLSIGSVEEAFKACEEALEIAGDNLRIKGRCKWQLGRIEWEKENFRSATDYILQGADDLRNSSPVEALLASLDLASLQATGRVLDLDEVCDSLAENRAAFRTGFHELNERVDDIIALIRQRELGDVAEVISGAISIVTKCRPRYLKRAT